MKNGDKGNTKNTKELQQLWKELMEEKKYGIHDIKITSNFEDKKIITYIKKHKTEKTFAFSREEISKGTGIPINKLPYTTIVKIPNIEFIIRNGKLWFTYITLWERVRRFFR